MINLGSISDHEYAPLSAVEEVSAASTELHTLSARCSELTREIARMRQLVDRLAQNADPSRPGESARGEHWSREAPGALGGLPRRFAKSNFWSSPSHATSNSPVRSELARACRIALMETREPASVEAIYDRIKRRESFTFIRYKRPFRSIVLAMSAMVRSGEVSLLNEAGHRRWLWGTEGMGDKSEQREGLCSNIPHVADSTEDSYHPM